MELVRFPSRGGFSVRSIFTFVLTVLATALLWATFSDTPTHAATTATWNGQNILFDNHAYGKAGPEINKQIGVDEKATVYSYIPQNTAGPNAGSNEAFFIYFAPGTDPPTATSADFVKFTIDGGKYTNARDRQGITMTPQGEADAVGSSCSVSGIGWIICPISTFLAESMDWLFGLIANFLVVKPLTLDINASNGLYTAWSVMRTIANIAFVIVFLIIIYSQLTGMGINSYGLKKLTPRLIVAAVLVNISFYIAAIAIDASNILGYSIQQVFESIRHDVFNMTDDTAGAWGNAWTNLTVVILGGGGILYGIGYAVVSGAVFALVPMLVMLALTLFVVLVILAARQGIIILLVIIAPLAFVANLLPNTENLFTKWRKLFTTMLVFFPAFSLIFGGAQLAGQLIVQNANGNIITVLFGMAVQVAPLAITPIMFKLSGSLLSRIGQMVNNPNKGPIDRTRKWADRKAGLVRSATMERNGSRNPFNPANLMRRLDDSAKNDADSTKAYTQGSENRRMTNSRRYGHIYAHQARADMDKEVVHNSHSSHIEREKLNPNSTFYARAITVEASKENLQSAQNVTNAHLNRQRTIAGTALNASSNYLEYSKMTLESSENEKTVYQMNQKLTSGTLLNSAVDRLETGKTRTERKQSQYSAMVDSMKLDTRTALHSAALGAQSAKELQEAAQNRVQAFFDEQRRTVGSGLNRSTITLEETKLAADASKSLTSAYISAEKLEVGSDLHLQVVRSEQAKLAGQVGEARVNKLVEEYKSGKIVRTGELSDLMTTMVDDVEHLAAESQGTQAAQNIQKKNIAEAFTAGTSRAQDLLRTAQSVDQYGDVRAEATALATLEDITNKARSANEALIEERAVSENKTPKNYAVDLLKKRLGGDMSDSEDIIRAAMEIAGKEAQIPIIRKMRMSQFINQDHLTAMLLRNSGTMKSKGGFDLQNDTGLVHATQEVMNASVAGTLGSVAAEQFKDIKNGAIIEYAKDMPTIIKDAEALTHSSDPTEKGYGDRGLEGIQKAYFNLTLALRDPQMVRALGDNLIPAIKMHRTIHRNARFHNDAMDVDYSAIDPQNLRGDIDPHDLGVGLKPE